ncbi:MAG: RsmD family RNA methyltransferase [Thermoanaerobaculum sp.]
MRITGGVWASRKVFGPPSGWPLRPTPDALREQAFSVLAGQLANAVFLDLFAGTGVVSLEALSRGAARAILVEPHPQALSLLRRNLALLGVEPHRVLVVPRAAEEAVPWLAAQGEKANVLWADPPFARFAEHLPTVAAVADSGLLVPGGLLVLEHPPKAAWELPGFSHVRALRGAVLLRFTGRSSVQAVPPSPASSGL